MNLGTTPYSNPKSRIRGTYSTIETLSDKGDNQVQVKMKSYLPLQCAMYISGLVLWQGPCT